MNSARKGDVAAKKLVDIIEDGLKHLPEHERNARWQAFIESAATLEIRAKQRALAKTARNPRATPKRAKLS